MRKGTLTRDQAVAIVGADAVNAVGAEECDFTNRVQTDGDTGVEFSASVDAVDTNGEQCLLLAYYYQDADVLSSAEDLSDLDWKIYAYAVI